MLVIKIDIVGGSISGLTAAMSIKEKNKKIHVVVHEKYKKIGDNHEGRRCGEAHAILPAWSKWMPSGKSIFNEIRKAEIYIGEEKHVFNREPKTGFMLNRPEFIKQLASSAEKVGTEIVTDDKIRSISELNGDIIIDASGCPSTIKKELGLNKGIKGITYQQTIEDSNCFFTDTIKIYFIGGLGYYWIFPRDPNKKEVNVGLGFVQKLNYNLKKMLEKFKKEKNIQGKINYVTGGLIPSGFQKPLSYNNILFIGDAGVGTFPLNGQGIYRALISGEVAGRCIANGYPKRYSKIMYKYFYKWELIGINVFRLNNIIRLINPNKSFRSINSINIMAKLAHI